MVTVRCGEEKRESTVVSKMGRQGASSAPWESVEEKEEKNGNFGNPTTTEQSANARAKQDAEVRSNVETVPSYTFEFFLSSSLRNVHQQ